jgi:hypothetical protein
MSKTLAFDPGYGSIKLFGCDGSLVMQSAVSISSGDTFHRMNGLRISRPPLKIRTTSGSFYVGENAHDWGRPVENLDFEKLTGSPEMLVLFLGAMTRYKVPPEPIDLIVGLPVVSLMGEEATTTQRKVKEFLSGTHSWLADGQEYRLQVENVRITSQPVGAMFDYLLDDEGKMLAGKRIAFKSEIGILGIGMNTVELLVVRNGSPIQRFTTGETLGVRRLLELVGHHGLYSLAELDTRLRVGSLDVSEIVPVWEREILGFVEQSWGNNHRRFCQVVIVGGGALILRDSMLRRFKAKTFIPDDPIIATARGLHKYMLMKERRQK